MSALLPWLHCRQTQSHQAPFLWALFFFKQVFDCLDFLTSSPNIWISSNIPQPGRFIRAIPVHLEIFLHIFMHSQSISARCATTPSATPACKSLPKRFLNPKFMGLVPERQNSHQGLKGGSILLTGRVYCQDFAPIQKQKPPTITSPSQCLSFPGRGRLCAHSICFCRELHVGWVNIHEVHWGLRILLDLTEVDAFFSFLSFFFFFFLPSNVCIE